MAHSLSLELVAGRADRLDLDSNMICSFTQSCFAFIYSIHSYFGTYNELSTCCVAEHLEFC